MSELLNALKMIEHFKHAPIQLGPDVESTVVPVTELAELRRKAAAYDAGVQGWAIKSGSAFHWVSDTDFVPKAHLSHWPGATVVPVRIVEVKE